MIPPHVAAYALLAIGVGGFVLAGGLPLSLGTDIGMTQEDICSTIEANAGQVVQRLDATSFPHASADPVERYRLTSGGDVKAHVQVDWFNGNAYCVPLDPSEPYTLSFDMTPTAYQRLTTELRSVVLHGHTTGSPGAYGVIAWGTDVTRPGGAHDRAYRVELASWAAGRAAHPEEGA